MAEEKTRLANLAEESLTKGMEDLRMNKTKWLEDKIRLEREWAEKVEKEQRDWYDETRRFEKDKEVEAERLRQEQEDLDKASTLFDQLITKKNKNNPESQGGTQSRGSMSNFDGEDDDFDKGYGQLENELEHGTTSVRKL